MQLIICSTKFVCHKLFFSFLFFVCFGPGNPLRSALLRWQRNWVSWRWKLSVKAVDIFDTNNRLSLQIGTLTKCITYWLLREKGKNLSKVKVNNIGSEDTGFCEGLVRTLNGTQFLKKWISVVTRLFFSLSFFCIFFFFQATKVGGKKTTSCSSHQHQQS